MKKKITLLLVAIVSFILAGNIYARRGIPFVREGEQWSIGIYTGKTPFSVEAPVFMWQPVLSAEDVTDVQAKFVADPFLMKTGDVWYLFFEVYNNRTGQGDLAYATSRNTRNWEYGQVMLDEPFHLSYPYVFEWEGAHYMIPESFEADSIRLYRAEEFPRSWSFVATLVEGRDYVDNSIVRYDGRWWMFSSDTSNQNLYLHFANELEGPWSEHPMSPLFTGDPHKSRPSGRLLVYEDRLYRFAMDVQPPAGTHRVMAYQITKITPEMYEEELAREEPIVQASGSGWNRDAMHQFDVQQMGPDRWVAAVDGFGNYLIFGWGY